MSGAPEHTRFNIYARQRLLRILLDMVASTKGVSWSSLADAMIVENNQSALVGIERGLEDR